MKKILLIIMAVCFAAPAFAADPIIQSKQIFNSYTGFASVARYSTPVDVMRFPQKSVIVRGMHSASVYNSYSGTFTLQGGPTINGPWMTLKNTAGNDATATTDAQIELNSMVHYIRGAWTRSKHRVSVWLFYQGL